MAQQLPSRSRDYCRKQKSLGLLCTNFLSLYNRDGIDTIGLDDAATRLGVERRRIYDIVNVLESVGMLSRMAKNQYSWKGFGGVPKALQALKDEGLKDTFTTFEGNNTNCLKASDDEDENALDSISLSQDDKSNQSSVGGSSMPSKAENRREKSLGILTQNFVKLFLNSNADLISLDEIAKILLGEYHEAPTMRNYSAAKVRRLYDIANVLSSMNFIEKTHHPETRKPAYRWLGMSRKAESGSKNDNVLNESKKRVFGTDISNTNISRGAESGSKPDKCNNESKKRVFGTDISISSAKRNKVVSQVDSELNETATMPLKMHVKRELLNSETERTNVDLDSRLYRNGYQFGPFAPVNVLKTGVAENSKVKEGPKLEGLVSAYRPQYNNPALKDLFSHYADAWKSWYSEVAGKAPFQLIS